MKTAIIFGATSGIGKALTVLLIKDGYQVAITGRREEKLIELKQQFPEQITTYVNNIQDVDAVANVFEEMVAKFQQVDLVIHSSGIGYINPKLKWEKEEEIILTNVKGATRLYDLVYNQFREQGYGHMVGITSIASIRGNRAAPAYFASKAYQKAYLESLFIKTKTIPSNKVFITDIRPGFVATPMALGDGIFWMTPLDKAANQIYKAIKKKKRVAYISKRWRLVAWVLKIAPAWLLKKVI